MIMRFGKFKGTKFEDTPKWYQDWLQKQGWFTMDSTPKLTKGEAVRKELSQATNKMKGWNGYSRSGAANEDNVFRLEQKLDDLFTCPSCCRDKGEDEEYCNGDYCGSPRYV